MEVVKHNRCSEGEGYTICASVHLGAYVVVVQVDVRVEAGEYHEPSDDRDLEQINIKHRTLLHLHLHPIHHHWSTNRRHTGRGGDYSRGPERHARRTTAALNDHRSSP